MEAEVDEVRIIMSVLILAEVGINHDGNLDKALRLCDAAKAAGADIVKTQTFIPEKCVRPGKNFELLKRLALSDVVTLNMARYCASIDIEFMSTPDDIDSLKFLVEVCGVKRIKLGSGSLLYEPLVDAAFDTGLPVLLSTGMATFMEVNLVVERQRMRWRENGHRPMNHLTVMHCVSLYPCPPQLANVGAVAELRKFKMVWRPDLLDMGYSDHTIGNYAILAAVALGATVVEKHFTLDNAAEGPDHRMSATPEQFETMVMKIRQTEVVLGNSLKEPSPEELAMIPRIRKDAEGFQPGL